MIEGIIVGLIVLGFTALGNLLYKAHPAFGRTLCRCTIFTIIGVLLLILSYILGETRIVRSHSEKLSTLENKYFRGWVALSSDSANYVLNKANVEWKLLDSVDRVLSLRTDESQISTLRDNSLIYCISGIAILSVLMIISSKLEELVKLKREGCSHKICLTFDNLDNFHPSNGIDIPVFLRKPEE